MRVTLEPTKDILSLYIPFVPVEKQRVEHTRSVLLQKKEKTFTILSSVTFSLVLSLCKTVPIDYLLRYMLLSYTRHAYAVTSKDSDANRHAPLQTVDGVEPAFVSTGGRYFLRRVDRENREDYEYVLKKGLLKAEDKEERAWQWFRPGSAEIEDEEYRLMANINFIRDIKQVSISGGSDKKTYENQTQYRILFDNHLILHYFLKQFKYGRVTLEHKGTKFECPLVLLDPTPCPGGGNRYEKFEGTNYLYYVEKQLNARENPEFHTHLHFKQVYPYTGGLLLPSTFDPQDALYTRMVNSVDNMETMCKYEDNSGARLNKKQQEGGKGFRLCYNRFFVDLSTGIHTHVEYFEREKMLGVAVTEKKKSKKIESKPKERVKLSKSQPTLHSVVEKIPHGAKRKIMDELETEHTVSNLVLNTTKKPRIEQTKLNHFFQAK